MRKKFEKIGSLLIEIMMMNEFIARIINRKSVVNNEIALTSTTIGTVTIDGVNIRRKNGRISKSLGSLYNGYKVKILKKMSNGWYKIEYTNGVAYVSSAFVKLEGVPSVESKILNKGIILTDENVITTSSSTDCKSESLSKNSEVEIVDVSFDNIYKIKYKGTYGYINSKYIKINSNASKEENLVKLNKFEREKLNNFLFVGDSFTHGLKDTIINNNDNVYVHAQSGSRPSYWLDRVSDMPNNESIEGISLLIGVNGLVNPNRDLYGTIKDTKELINKLIVKYPNKIMYVQKVFPVGREFILSSPCESNKLIKNFNEKLEEFCESKANTKFIDTTYGFVNDDGYMINTEDGLHVAVNKRRDYYENIFREIKNEEKKTNCIFQTLNI